MNKDINPEILQLFMGLVSVASKDSGPVLSKILEVVHNSEAEDYEWDAKRQQLVVCLHTDETETAFTCHMDTVSDMGPTLPIFDAEKGVVSTKGRFTSCLGADCRAGIAIMLYMIQNNVPGYYFFFNEEEKGLVGSEAMARRYEAFPIGVQCLIDRMISFDRGGYDEIITHQFGIRTCSDEFALALATALNDQCGDHLCYEPSVNGGRTDSYSFRGVIPECTNIAMGYLDPHSKKETQDLVYLSKIAEATVEIDWDALPTARDVNVIETLTKHEREKKSTSEVKTPQLDLTDIKYADRQDFIAFAEERLDKFIPSFHDSPMNRRAFVKLLEHGFTGYFKWEAVLDKASKNMIPNAGTPSNHFLRWLENFGYKVVDEFLSRTKAASPVKATKKTQDVVEGTAAVTTGGITYHPPLWVED